MRTRRSRSRRNREHRTLRAVVEEAKTLRGNVRSFYLFCNRRGQAYTGNGFRTIWQKAMRKAIDRGVIAERFTGHDIRAKAAAGMDARRLLAHQSQATTDRYIKTRQVERITVLKRKG